MREKNLEDRTLQIYSKFYSRNEAYSPSGGNSRANNINTANKLTSDIKGVKDTFESFKQVTDKVDALDKTLNNKTIAAPLSLVPFLRRIRPIESSKAEENNNVKLAGLGVLGVINLKEDLRDTLTVFGRSKSNAEKGYYSVYKFFSGTLLEKPLKKTKWGRNILYNIDKTFGETNLAKKLYKIIGVKFDKQEFEKETTFFKTNKEISQRKYIKFFSASEKNISKYRLTAGKIIGTTMHKMPLLGIAFASILELPQVIKAVKNKEYKQIPKSATSVLSISIGGAITTTILGMTLGPAGGVIGLGLGMYIGSLFAKYINSKY
jgi:hypothetical protein